MSEKPVRKVNRKYTPVETKEEEQQLLKLLSIQTKCYFDYQRERMSLDNRLGLTKNGEIKKGFPDLGKNKEALVGYLLERRDAVVAMELQTEKEIGEFVRQHPLWHAFLKDILGCKYVMSAVIISEFDIYKADAVSNLWSFAGLAPGKDRLVKGQKATFNKFLKSKLLGVLGPAFLRADALAVKAGNPRSPYAVFYRDYRHRKEQADWGSVSPNPTDKNKPKAGHQHKAANRYMVKMFLKDLYVAWRTLEGLPVREPYEEEYLGKKHSA